VLDDPGVKVLGGEIQGVPLPVVGLDLDLPVAGDLPPEIDDAQAPLPVLDHLLRGPDDLRVDEDHQRDGRGLRIAGVPLDLQDGDLDRDMDLGRCQPDPVVLAHGLDHVVNEALELLSPDGFKGDGSGHHSGDGMSQLRNL